MADEKPQTLKLKGLSDGEFFFLIAEARAAARVVNGVLRDCQSDDLAGAVKGEEIDGDDLVSLALTASSKIDRIYQALYGEEAVSEVATHG